MELSTLKELARQAGADLVGVAPHSRWCDLPAEQNPATLMPQCRSVMVLGRRVLRGSLRGVEEGTNLNSTYRIYGLTWNEHDFLARALYQVGVALEREGHEAMPLYGGFSSQSAVKLNTKELAHLAGLGSIGKGGFFLTPQYGHRQRFGLVLTDVEIAGEPLVDVDFCRDCDACLRACPLGAITRGKDETANFTIDSALCERCRNGQMETFECAYERSDRQAASCGRACLVAVEKKISNQFQAPFRKRSIWTRDIDGKCTVQPLANS